MPNLIINGMIISAPIRLWLMSNRGQHDWRNAVHFTIESTGPLRQYNSSSLSGNCGFVYLDMISLSSVEMCLWQQFVGSTTFCLLSNSVLGPVTATLVQASWNHNGFLNGRYTHQLEEVACQLKPPNNFGSVPQTCHFEAAA